MFLFDTSVFSYALQGHSFAQKYSEELESKSALFISAQTVEEILFVAYKRQWGATKMNHLESAFKRFRILGIDQETGRISAALRVKAEIRGLTLSAPDAWIMATALQYDYSLVTHDRDMLAAAELGLKVIFRA